MFAEIPQKNNVVYSFKQEKSYFDIRGEEDIEKAETGQRSGNMASRLVPHDFVVNNSRKATRMLKFLLLQNPGFGHYFLGGVVNDPEAEATAVHPAMRKAVWQINTFTLFIYLFIYEYLYRITHVKK